MIGSASPVVKRVTQTRCESGHRSGPIPRHGVGRAYHAPLRIDANWLRACPGALAELSSPGSSSASTIRQRPQPARECDCPASPASAGRPTYSHPYRSPHRAATGRCRRTQSRSCRSPECSGPSEAENSHRSASRYSCTSGMTGRPSLSCSRMSSTDQLRQLPSAP